MLMAGLDLSELTLSTFNTALMVFLLFEFSPKMLVPNPRTKVNYKSVLKIHIARVMHTCIATPKDASSETPCHPIPVEEVNQSLERAPIKLTCLALGKRIKAAG